ncbi:hypothetical protein [Actinoplanes sp. NPDC049265]|uniref:hypothetical protein n=1 Tax=Actinoplanes sp. NPDC049265 TaxID=3363902 RepID=UPI00371CC892
MPADRGAVLGERRLGDLPVRRQPPRGREARAGRGVREDAVADDVRVAGGRVVGAVPRGERRPSWGVDVA